MRFAFGDRSAQMRLLITAALAASILAMAAPAAAQKRAVGLGVGAGVALPKIKDVSTDAAFSWGFYTDIPLISTFHITPSTIVYRIDPSEGNAGTAATDVSLNFKFIVPLGPLDLFAGVTAGVTSAQDLNPHVGALLGGSLNLVSNLDVFANVNYRLVIQDGSNVGTWHIFAGPLFRFEY